MRRAAARPEIGGDGCRRTRPPSIRTGAVMKVRNSLKSLRSRHRDNRLVRRQGRLYIINKTNAASRPGRADEPRAAPACPRRFAAGPMLPSMFGDAKRIPSCPLLSCASPQRAALTLAAAAPGHAQRSGAQAAKARARGSTFPKTPAERERCSPISMLSSPLPRTRRPPSRHGRHRARVAALGQRHHRCAHGALDEGDGRRRRPSWP